MQSYVCGKTRLLIRIARSTTILVIPFGSEFDVHETKILEKMLRFLSRRKGRNTSAGENRVATTDGQQHQNTASQIKPQRIVSNKNLIQCRVILLDGTDLSVDLTVSVSRHSFIAFTHSNVNHE